MITRASERVSKHLEQREEKDSPKSAPDDPDESGGETAAQGNHQNHQEGPEDDGKRRDGDTDTPCRDTAPEDPRGELEALRGVEGVRDRRKVVDDTDYDGIGPRSDENARVVETNALRRDRGPGDPRGDQEAMGTVERNWKREIDGDGDDDDGRWWGMDGATSAARRDSKRVKMDALAEYQASQHEQRQRMTTNVPGPSTPPPNHHRRPHTHPNPPRRRGRLKTRPTSVSNPRRAYQVIRARLSRIGRI